MIDWNVRIGDLLIVASLAGTGVVYAFKSGRFAESIENMRKDITALETTVKIVGEVLTMVAVQKTEIRNIQDDIRELRHGDGWIQKPIVREFP